MDVVTEIPQQLAQDVLALARRKGVQIATAESCTGGMIIGALTEIAGSSDVVDRGFITYSNAAKMGMLGGRAAVLEAHGAVSEEVARDMAEGALSKSDATIALAVTGIAGPGGSEFKPEGRVCFGCAVTGMPTRVETVEFGAIGRAQVRSATIKHALGMVRALLSTR